MEFDPTMIRCPKCKEQLSLFFQRDLAVSVSNSDQQIQMMQESINQIKKRFNELLLSLEDRDERLIKLEDFVDGSIQGPEKSQQPEPQQSAYPPR